MKILAFMDIFLLVILVIIVFAFVQEIANNIDEIMKYVVGFCFVILCFFLLAKGCSVPRDYNSNLKQQNRNLVECEAIAIPQDQNQPNLNLDQYTKIPGDLSIDARFGYLENMMGDVQKYMNNGFHLTNESIRNYHTELMKGFSLERNMLAGIRHSLEEERDKLQKERDNQLIESLKMVYLGAIAGWVLSVLFSPENIFRRKVPRSFKTFNEGRYLHSTIEIRTLRNYYGILGLEFCNCKHQKQEVTSNFLKKVIKILAIAVSLTLLMTVFEYLFYYFR